MGTPCESIRVARKFRFCRARRALISGSSVGPSAPMFHERLSFSPSWLSSPLASFVAVVVRDEIVEREPVVPGDEVDAREGPAARAFVEVGAAGEPIGELAQRPLRAPPVVAHGVPVFAVPLRPQGREVADLGS